MGYGAIATCWNSGAGYACQCQCGAGTSCGGQCPGSTCFDVTNDNYCSY